METELRHALSTAERAVAEVEERLAAQERAHQEQSGVQQQLMHQAYASTQALDPTLILTLNQILTPTPTLALTLTLTPPRAQASAVPRARRRRARGRR